MNVAALDRSASRTVYPAVDVADLAPLAESIADVLAEEAGSLAIHAHIDGRERLDRALWARAADLGWFAIGWPERLGGLGVGPRGLAALFAGLGAQIAPGPFLSTLCAAQALVETADEGLLDEWLPKIAAGECRIAIPAQFGSGGGQDGAPLTFVGDPDSELFLVPASGGCWQLRRFDQGDVARLDIWDRTRSLARVDPTGGERVALLPAGGEFAERLSLHMALALAAESLGAASALLARTVQFMKERRQFDRPIASFQALKHRVADMKTRVVAGEAVLEQAVAALAEDNADAAMWTALAKARLVEDFGFVGQECLQMHGGVGFTWEYDVHVFLKRARLNDMLLAPGWTMRDRAAAGLGAAVAENRSTLELQLI